MGSIATPAIERSNGLPPAQYWIIDPSQKHKTPVDNRGLIVVDELIETTKQYICPEYQDWGIPDKHHLYYTSTVYELIEALSRGDIPAHQFRELPVNKILIPRRFHNVIHRVMLPADVPRPKVMRNYIDAWTTARNLFAGVRSAVDSECAKYRRGRKGQHGLSEQEIVDEEISEEVLRRHFTTISGHVGALALISDTFRPLKLDGDVPESVSQLCDVLEHGRQRRTNAVLSPGQKEEPCQCLRCRVNRSIITSVIN